MTPFLVLGGTPRIPAPSRVPAAQTQEAEARHAGGWEHGNRPVACSIFAEPPFH